MNLSTDVANNGEPLSAPSQRPNLICNPNNGPKTTAEWFNTSCFTMPAAFTYGNAGRDIVTGPGLDDFDATMQKEFPVRENMRLQFRLDIFDFFNHPNFNAACRGRQDVQHFLELRLDYQRERSPRYAVFAAARVLVYRHSCLCGFRDCRRAGLEIPRVQFAKPHSQEWLCYSGGIAARWPAARFEEPSFAFPGARM